MAIKRPVALYAGALELLRAGDALPASSVRVVSANTTAAVGDLVYCDTAGLIITAPATPSAGDWFAVGVAGFVNTTVARNGANIVGLAEDFVIDVPRVVVEFIYVDTTHGWRVK